MDWYIKCINKYADFDGRASRSEYWYYTLFNYIFLIAAMIVGGILSNVSGIFAALGLLYALGTLIPSVAVTTRRLHDTGRSGWLQLITIIPFVGLIGAIVLIIFLAQDSSFDRNQYGPNPKRPASV
ncbi:MAG: DUF805 domain-containing protein [Cyanobacteria bacterium J06649_4]